MLNFARKIFFNDAEQPSGSTVLPEAYLQQVRAVRLVWEERSYGLERLVRLVLCVLQFCFPVLLLRDVFGRWGITGRRLAVEAYTVLKFVFPLAALKAGWYHHPFVIFLTVYFFCDTFTHILHLVFLDDIHQTAVSYRRSLLLIFFHYLETVFDFALVYRAFDLLKGPIDTVGALYFSMVSTTTVGFGDITAKAGAGQVVVAAQLLVCLVFVVVFINYFSQKINRS